VLPSGKKLTLGLLATIILEVLLFHAYAPFSALLPFFKCILEVVFFDGVQRRLRFCLDHLNCVKMAAFQFYLQSWKQRKVGKRGEKGNVRLCIVLMQQPAPFSPKFGAKSSHIFTQSP
jgi:hypothetical protein